MTARTALGILIAASACIRIVWSGSIGLGHDEAYHYLFTVHRDWSYFDHPPMLALVGSIGPWITGEAAAWSLRLGFIALFAGSTLVMYRLSARFFGPWAGFCAALALNVSAYHTAAAGAFALPDGPLLFFWLLTLDRLAVAVESPGRITPWLIAGLAWGGALLSKYHAVFLPMGLVVYLVFEKSARPILKKPGPYLAVLVGVLAFAPVLYWNANHQWASFLFQGGRAVAKLRFNPISLLRALGGQAAYLLPWIWIFMLIALATGFRRLIKGEATAAERFLLSQSVVPLTLFTAVASVRDVLPHWTLVAYLSTYPLVGRLWAARLATQPTTMRRRLCWAAAVPLVVMTIFAAQYRTGFLGLDRFLPPRADPTVESFGWDQLAAEIERRGLIDDRTFLFTSMWYDSGQVGYATRSWNVPVACYHPNDSRSFAYWSDPSAWVGRTGILIAAADSPTEPACFDNWFERIEPLGDVPIVRNGRVVRRFKLYRCENQTMPFPFDYRAAPVGAGRVAAKVEAAERR